MTLSPIWATAALCLLLGSKTSFAEGYGSGWYGELQLSYGHEDNISRSYWKPDEVSDETTSFSIGGGHSRKIGHYGQLVFYGYVDLNVHDEYDDLDSIATSLGMSYTYQPNPAFSAIWYQTDVRVTNLNYENSDGREGVMANLDFSINRRFGTLTSGHLGYRYKDKLQVGRTRAEEQQDDAFDTTTHELYVGIDREIYPFVYAYGEYAFRRGDTWSNLSSRAGLARYDAESIDSVFDDCAPGDFSCQPRYAGRAVSDIHRINLGVVFPVKSINIDVSTTWYHGKADNGNNYKDRVHSVGLIWNF